MKTFDNSKHSRKYDIPLYFTITGDSELDLQGATVDCVFRDKATGQPISTVVKSTADSSLELTEETESRLELKTVLSREDLTSYPENATVEVEYVLDVTLSTGVKLPGKTGKFYSIP